MSDFKLDNLTHDLDVSNYDFSLVTDEDEIVQSLKIRLWFFRGEWFLDTESGVPYYEDILIKNPNIPNVDAILKSVIVETPGVLELTAYESTFDAENRSLTVIFTVNTDVGELTITQEL